MHAYACMHACHNYLPTSQQWTPSLNVVVFVSLYRSPWACWWWTDLEVVIHLRTHCRRLATCLSRHPPPSPDPPESILICCGRPHYMASVDHIQQSSLPRSASHLETTPEGGRGVHTGVAVASASAVRSTTSFLLQSKQTSSSIFMHCASLLACHCGVPRVASSRATMEACEESHLAFIGVAFAKFCSASSVDPLVRLQTSASFPFTLDHLRHRNSRCTVELPCT